MSNRVKTVLEHIHSGRDTDAVEMQLLKRHLAIQSLRAQFHLAPERLREMAAFMLHEMHSGLEPNSTSTLRMLPSFVYKKDMSRTTGIFYALDLGGSNFRVIRMQVRGGELLKAQAKKFAIPPKLMVGNGVDLFDFIASSIEEFLAAHSLLEERAKGLPLGFTFSFPVEQHSVASGALIKWTKQFKATGVEGKDVVVLLREACARRKVNMTIAALCNDTVGTLVKRYFEDQTAELGVILGTGSNACYWERTDKIVKSAEAQARGTKAEMCINMEFGNFDSTHMLVLPRTSFDDELDAASENRGQQRLEKMISGKYLGEIARRVIVRLAEQAFLEPKLAQVLAAPYCFESKSAGTCVADRHPGLLAVAEVFELEHGIKLASKSDRWLVAEVCCLVSQRAAQLAGMAVAATLLKRNKQHDATVAVDGSVFEKQPGFRVAMEGAVKAVLPKDASVRLQLTRDGSGLGAGFIAAMQ